MDRHVPVAVIFTLLLQMAGALIWATQLDARVQYVEGQSAEIAQSSERLARIEERLQFMKQDVEAIRRQLDNLTNMFVKK